jgi:DNA-binding transcriptional MocR family regulator
VAPHKYETVAGLVRDMIADGTLKPGAPAPSGAALARETGFRTLTCRKALRALLADGTLTWGASPNARLRVAARMEEFPGATDPSPAVLLPVSVTITRGRHPGPRPGQEEGNDRVPRARRTAHRDAPARSVTSFSDGSCAPRVLSGRIWVNRYRR